MKHGNDKKRIKPVRNLVNGCENRKSTWVLLYSIAKVGGSLYGG